MTLFFFDSKLLQFVSLFYKIVSQRFAHRLRIAHVNNMPRDQTRQKIIVHPACQVMAGRN